MLAGDVESNLGPMSKAQEEQLSQALELLHTLNTNVSTLMSNHASTDNALLHLSNKVTAVESSLSLLKDAQTALVESLRLDLAEVKSTAMNTAVRITSLSYRVNDLEDRLCPSNAVFYGIPDSVSESWAESEAKVIDICSNQLNIECSTSDFERAHRIGKFNNLRSRPVIVKFCNFKLKDKVVSAGHKLKGTAIKVSNDFSATTRLTRRQLIEYGKSQKLPFKLRYDKLYTDSKSFYFDP